MGKVIIKNPIIPKASLLNDKIGNLNNKIIDSAIIAISKKFLFPAPKANAGDTDIAINIKLADVFLVILNAIMIFCL